MCPFKMASCIFIYTSAWVSNAAGSLPRVRQVIWALRNTELLQSPAEGGQGRDCPLPQRMTVTRRQVAGEARSCLRVGPWWSAVRS